MEAPRPEGVPKEGPWGFLSLDKCPGKGSEFDKASKVACSTVGNASRRYPHSL